MKDLIAKLQMDANITLGAIWLHIDAQAARIAELEAKIAAASAPVVEQQPLIGIEEMCKILDAALIKPIEYTDSTIVYQATFDQLRNLYSEGKAASTVLQAPVREVPDDLQIVPKISTSKMDRAGEAVIEGENHCDCGNYPMPNLEKVFSAMLAAAPLPAAPAQQDGDHA